MSGEHHLVDKRCLAVVDVCDDGYVSNILHLIGGVIRNVSCIPISILRAKVLILTEISSTWMLFLRFKHDFFLYTAFVNCL